MSLNAVYQVYKNQIDNLQSAAMLAAGISPMHCFIAPPQVVVDTLEAPEVYLWAEPRENRRTTMPSTPTHTGGFRRWPWEMHLHIFWIEDPTPSDTNWPLILDAIRIALEQIVYPQTLTDLNSIPAQTQLVMASEMFDLENDLPTAIEDQSNLLYTAHFTCHVFEDYQA